MSAMLRSTLDAHIEYPVAPEKNLVMRTARDEAPGNGKKLERMVRHWRTIVDAEF
jgi:hypothetical protein